MSMTESSVWIACLASYNRGELHGSWLTIPLIPDDLLEEINEVLDTSPVPGAEEWAIFDYDGPIARLQLGEHIELGRLCRMAELIRDYGPIATWVLEVLDLDVERALPALDSMTGPFETYDEIAEEYLGATGEWTSLPEHLRRYIDLERYGHDLANDFTQVRVGFEEGLRWEVPSGLYLMEDRS